MQQKQHNKLRIFLLIFACVFGSAYAIDPLSKIMISSKQATCKRDSLPDKDMIVTYKDSVVVTLADGATITAGQLEMVMDGVKLGGKKKSSSELGALSEAQKNQLDATTSGLKKIEFSENVCVTRQGHVIKANRALMLPEKRSCVLRGNVQVEQKKQTDKDIPLTMASDVASYDLRTGKLTFVGTAQPVRTVITLQDHPALQYKKKAEKKRLKTLKKRTS